MPVRSSSLSGICRQFGRAPLWLALTAIIGACGGYAHTARKVNGKLLIGRPIAPQAYALYFSAAAAEARGELRRARDLYLAAEESDPDSPELWTRIGALSCRLKLAMADAEIRAALELDNWYAPAWRERARCELSRGKLERALRFALRAQVADASDFQTTALLAAIHMQRRALRAAEAQLLGYTLSYPDVTAGWRALRAFASTNALKHWELYAAERLNALGEHSLSQRTSLDDASCSDVSTPFDASSSPDAAETALINALLAEDLAAAQQCATMVGISQLRVIGLALKLGKAQLAVRQAGLLIGAAPHDSQARVWGLLAAHRADDSAAFTQWLALPDQMTGLDAATVDVLETLVQERLAVAPEREGVL